LPSVSDVTDAVSDALVTAIDTAEGAATVIIASARRRPKVAIGVGIAAVVVLAVVVLLRRRRAVPEPAARDDHKPHVVAA